MKSLQYILAGVMVATMLTPMVEASSSGLDEIRRLQQQGPYSFRRDASDLVRDPNVTGSYNRPIVRDPYYSRSKARPWIISPRPIVIIPRPIYVPHYSSRYRPRYEPYRYYSRVEPYRYDSRSRYGYGPRDDYRRPYSDRRERPQTHGSQRYHQPHWQTR